MTSPSDRLVVLTLVAVSIGLLIPGLFAPVLTIRGVLTRDGVAHVAPMMLERGLSDETIAVLKSMLNPAILGLLQAGGIDLRKTSSTGSPRRSRRRSRRAWRRFKSTSRRAASSGR